MKIILYPSVPTPLFRLNEVTHRAQALVLVEMGARIPAYSVMSRIGGAMTEDAIAGAG